MLTLSFLADEMGVCRLSGADDLPEWALDAPFFSVTRTPDELSIVCPAALIPSNVQAERGWRCLQVHGPLDFSLTGVLLSLAEPLAAAGVSIFAISTYDTDYLLVRGDDLATAVNALQRAGHQVKLASEH